MTASTRTASATTPALKGKKVPTRITWEHFKRRYLSREDRFKYEWVNGLVEKTPRTMDQKQQLIFLNLLHWFNKLREPGKALGELLAEVDSFFGKNHRRPDVSFFTEAQIAAFQQGNQEPQFVIEIISSTDQMARVHKKMQDYRRANIPVIWHIFPELQEVHVYNGDNMTICRGEKPCSGAPVLPEFSIPAEAIFAASPNTHG